MNGSYGGRAVGSLCNGTNRASGPIGVSSLGKASISGKVLGSELGVVPISQDSFQKVVTIQNKHIEKGGK